MNQVFHEIAHLYILLYWLSRFCYALKASFCTVGGVLLKVEHQWELLTVYSYLLLLCFMFPFPNAKVC